MDSNLQPNCSPCRAQLPCGNQVGCLIVPIIVTDEPKEEEEEEEEVGKEEVGGVGSEEGKEKERDGN